MDISNWPIGDILQLPRFIFGRRWMVGTARNLVGAAAHYSISDAMLPDKFIIWEMSIQSKFASSSSIQVTLATGMELPTTDAQFYHLPLVFPDVRSVGGVSGSFDAVYLDSNIVKGCKIPIMNSGRYLVGRYIRTVGTGVGCQINLIISSVPREVPDWFLKQ